MPQFWRIYNNMIIPETIVPKLGFSYPDNVYNIPDDYIEGKVFSIMRTCHSLGDWGIISAMPRLLKQKYPDCKVVVPTPKLLESMFHPLKNNWKQWENPFENANMIFQNNPYVDYFMDSIPGEVFHDHYRIYDDNNPEVPLVKQMLYFWGFNDLELVDYLPELYFSKEEKDLGDFIIKSILQDKEAEFGSLLLTNTTREYYDDKVNRLLIDRIQEYKDLPFIYYGSKDISETEFNFLNIVGDIKKLPPMPLRVQLYIKTKAKVNIGYHSGINDSICRYTKVIATPMHPNNVETLRENYLDKVEYLRYEV